jgi:hypothetical protein
MSGERWREIGRCTAYLSKSIKVAGNRCLNPIEV